jgi:hypothetical protein
MNRLRCASYRPQRSRAKDRLGRLRGDQLGKRRLTLAHCLSIVGNLRSTSIHEFALRAVLEPFSLLN